MPPRYFSGESARRMENIRGLRRTQAVRQVGRVIGSGAIGATQGAVAGSEWLAANPVHTYDRDRQRFYEALAAATPQMQMALERENQIQNRALQRQVQALGALRDVMGEQAATARKNGDIILSRQLEMARYQFNNGQRDLNRLENGTPEAQELLNQYLNNQGLTPELQGLGMRSGGGARSSGAAFTEAEIRSARASVNPRNVFGGQLSTQNMDDLTVAANTGALSITQPGGAELRGAAGLNGQAALINYAGSGMTEQQKLELLRQRVGSGYDDNQLRSALSNTQNHSAAFTGTEDLPPGISSAVENQARAIASQNRGAGGGGTGAGGSLPNASAADNQYLAMTDAEFANATSQVVQDPLPPNEVARLQALREQAYGEAASAVEGLVQRVTTADAEGYQNLTDAVRQINQISNATGLRPEIIWDMVKVNSPLAAVSNSMTWTQALSEANEVTGRTYDEAMQAPLNELERVRGVAFSDAGVRAAADEMLNTHESFRKESGRAAAETRAIAGTPEAQSGSGERAELTPQETAEIQRQAEEAEAQAQQEAEDEAFRQQGYTSMYGLEVPTSSIPDQDDLGGRVLFAWDLAEQYPAHPPLQQFIQDQMSSPEFAEWMSDRGYVGAPTKELFREFQREYRQVRRMNEIHNRRQRRLSRAAQDRLGMGEDASRAVGQAAAGEMPEEGAYTRARTQQYRRGTGKEARELSKNIRDVQRGRPTAEQSQEESRAAQAGAPREVQPTLAQRIAQRRQQQQQSSPTPPRTRVEFSDEDLLVLSDGRQG